MYSRLAALISIATNAKSGRSVKISASISPRPAPIDNTVCIFPLGTGKAAITERRQHTAHVDVAKRGWVRHLVKAPVARAADIAAVSEVNAATLSEPPRQGREIVVGPRA